jgi:molecular chaperone HtpG
MTERKIDILSLGTDDSQRQLIRNIVDSYHHDWDVLAELCQNAVDAVREIPSRSGSVNVTYDCHSRVLVVHDTGVGMDEERLGKAIAPNVTFKRGQPTLIGEKGLGLTFCAFRTNDMQIESSTGNGWVHRAIFRGARDWLEGLNPDRPMVHITSTELDSPPFTKVTCSDFTMEFDLDLHRLKHILLTNTALGCTYGLWKELSHLRPQLAVSLIYIPPAGAPAKETLEHLYWHPADHLSHRKTMAEVKELASHNKIRDFKGWGLVDRRCVNVSLNRQAYVCTLMLSVPEYDKLAQEYELLPRYKMRVKEAERTGSPISREDEPGDIEPGIYLSVRGMPTGIVLPFPTGTTEAGYWNNFYFLFEADWLSFDAGRKVVPGRTQELIKRTCLGIWNEMRAWKTRFIGHEGEDSVDQFAEKQKQTTRVETVKQYPDMPLGKIPFAKEPRTEQAVIAVFHEIVGRGLLKGYLTFDINTATTYDAIVKYTLSGDEVGSQALQLWQEKLNKKTLRSIDVFPLNLEFKYEAADILDDIADRTKYLDQIDLIVSWSCDKARFDNAGVLVQDIEREAELFNGASKRLEFGSNFPTQRHVYLMVLKELALRLESEG